MQLNAQQRLAVTTTDTPLLVLAGAGSGKTGVITQKIAWLINHKSVSPENIFAVTFTNKAATEMRMRLERVLAREFTRPLSITTFHRLGLHLLQRDGTALGLRRGFTIMDPSDAAAALREIIREHQLPTNEKLAALRISDWKNRFIDPPAAAVAASTDVDQAAAAAYVHYQSLLQACNSTDFDDLIGLPVKLLRDHPDIAERWQNRVRHLLVDEYQDTNEAQYELVRRLVGRFGVLTAVGDDDQSIYSWRGANPDNLRLLQQDYPNLLVIKLEQNYRSSQRILRCANAVISNNSHVFEKRLWSALTIGDPVRISVCQNAQDEADWVAAEIHSLRFRKNLRYGDVAILYRSNFQSRLFEQSLREKQIPYRISGGASFFDRSEIKDVMAYLKLMVNPDNDTAFLRVINMPRREIGASTLQKLGLYANKRRSAMLPACTDLGLSEWLNERAYDRLSNFAHWITLMADHAERGDPVAVIRRMLEKINYIDWLRQQAASKPAADRAIENVDELLAWIERQFKQDTTDKRSLSDVVGQITLLDMLSRKETEEEVDQVQMMTLHAAKGLEFPHVYLVGAEEQILPHRSSIDADTVEEERRLAYVGMTRARYNLTFTWARSRQKYGASGSGEASRFLDELPREDVHFIGEKPSAEAIEHNRQTGRDTLSSLRALLSGN